MEVERGKEGGGRKGVTFQRPPEAQGERRRRREPRRGEQVEVGGDWLF